jgi:NAD(P)-dependent dehydrogenase (short-subunit alcohol dehydrogenase family)
MRLKDSVAIVTGAAQGLGQRFAIALSQEGAKTIALDINDPRETVRQIESSGGI